MISDICKVNSDDDDDDDNNNNNIIIIVSSRLAAVVVFEYFHQVFLSLSVCRTFGRIVSDLLPACIEYFM